MAGWLFLIASLVGVVLVLSAVTRPSKGRWISVPHFLAGWLTAELALHHVVWQALATAVFAWFGALETTPGRVGLALALGSWVVLLATHERDRRRVPGVVAAALAEHADTVERRIPLARIARPFRMKRAGVERISNLAYASALPGDRGRRNLIDVVRPADAKVGERRPALLQIHGGAWILGDKEQQGNPLLYQLAERGWVGFAANYRLSPEATFPDQIVDVKRAIAWVREHAAEYGADPGFICITGGSAGGHLTALAALTANDPAYQPGFEHADTRVAAAVPFYGVYDLLDRNGVRGRNPYVPFLEQRVFKCAPGANPELWENASPLARVHADAPPFLVIHGTHDALVYVDEARLFVRALREKSRNPVVYLEIPGAQHAFDLFHSVRSAHAVHAVTAFLEKLRPRA